MFVYKKDNFQFVGSFNTGFVYLNAPHRGRHGGQIPNNVHLTFLQGN